MTYDEELAVRRRLDEVAGAAPPVGFGPADLVRRGRRRRQQRRGLAIAASAAVLALVVAAPAVVLRDRGPDSTGTLTGATPSATRTAAPAATPTPSGGISVLADGERIPGPIPGVSAERARAIARGCGRAYGGDIGHVDPTPGPGETQGPLVRDAVRVFNVVTDGFGSHALLYGSGVGLSCDFRGSDYNAGGFAGHRDQTAWLPGPVALDLHTGNQTVETVEGRVISAAATVQVRASGRTMRVTPVNGTYIARFPAPGSDTGNGDTVVTAYSRGGRVLGTADGQTSGCFTAPGGEIVIPGRGSNRDCRPATPWR